MTGKLFHLDVVKLPEVTEPLDELRGDAARELRTTQTAGSSHYDHKNWMQEMGAFLRCRLWLDPAPTVSFTPLPPPAQQQWFLPVGPPSRLVATSRRTHRSLPGC
ncbi:hypothetical protein INR49_017641 [Caranx melampygus]|nr:hypothetical protein INR49_017641 [Caranx melampygus]